MLAEFNKPLSKVPPSEALTRRGAAGKGDSQARMANGQRHQEARDLGRALYLDTETTGLGPGAGTVAFLVGLAWFDAGDSPGRVSRSASWRGR